MKVMNSIIRIYMIIAHLGIYSISAQISSQCPKECSYCVENVLICESGGFLEFPKSLPSHIQNITLVGHHFLSNYLSRANMSNIPNQYRIQYLAIRGSSIQEIKSFTFSNLRNLRVLDLSENQILKIQDYAFEGLNLDTLKLNDIGKLKLFPRSFTGLIVKNLYINNSRLGNLDYTVFESLVNNTFNQFSLANNNFRSIDSKFKKLFEKVSFLDLHGNPLFCNCSLLWLKKFSNFNQMKYTQINLPKCVSPSSLRDKTLTEIHESEFKCFPPKIREIYFNIIDEEQVQLTCKIDQLSNLDRRQNDFLEISWYEGSKLVVNSSDPELSLVIHKYRFNQHKTFTCQAKNKIGQSFLNVTFNWPKLGYEYSTNNTLTNNKNRFLINSKALDKFKLNKELQNENQMLDTITLTTSTSSFYFKKRYTLVELIVAVVSTFVCTLLLFLIIYKLCVIKTCCDSYPQKPSSLNNNTSVHYHQNNISPGLSNPNINHLQTGNLLNSTKDKYLMNYPPQYPYKVSTNLINLLNNNAMSHDNIAASAAGENNSQTYDCISVNNALVNNNNHIATSNNNNTPSYHTMKLSNGIPPSCVTSNNFNNTIGRSSSSSSPSQTLNHPPIPPPLPLQQQPQFIDYKTHERVFVPHHLN